jgi:hypothetical protein
MTASEAIEYLNSFEFDAVFLDHDLGEKTMVASGPGTGYEVAVMLKSNHKPL